MKDFCFKMCHYFILSLETKFHVMINRIRCTKHCSVSTYKLLLSVTVSMVELQRGIGFTEIRTCPCPCKTWHLYIYRYKVPGIGRRSFTVTWLIRETHLLLVVILPLLWIPTVETI